MAFNKCLITVDENNYRFSIDRYFLVDNIEHCLVHHFGYSVGVGIWQEVEILGESCFAWSKLESVTFESESRLRRIEKSCFSGFSLTSICIPRNVEILGESCFAGNLLLLNSLESITFETNPG
jgi:hypothetical protein